MKKLLIVIDYQNDFVDGALGFEGAEKLEQKLLKRIEKAKSENEDIIFTKDVHSKDYMETEEGKYLPIPHCIEGTPGCEFYGKIKEAAEGYPVFGKGAFSSIDLGIYLKDKKYDEITLVGLVSYICVLCNAIIVKAALPNAHIIVEKNLTDAADKKAQEIGFEALRNIQVEIK